MDRLILALLLSPDEPSAADVFEDPSISTHAPAASDDADAGDDDGDDAADDAGDGDDQDDAGQSDDQDADAGDDADDQDDTGDDADGDDADDAADDATSPDAGALDAIELEDDEPQAKPPATEPDEFKDLPESLTEVIEKGNAIKVESADALISAIKTARQEDEISGTLADALVAFVESTKAGLGFVDTQQKFIKRGNKRAMDAQAASSQNWRQNAESYVDSLGLAPALVGTAGKRTKEQQAFVDNFLTRGIKLAQAARAKGLEYTTETIARDVMRRLGVQPVAKPKGATPKPNGGKPATPPTPPAKGANWGKTSPSAKPKPGKPDAADGKGPKPNRPKFTGSTFDLEQRLLSGQ